jgi:putative ABC transport system permease protein
MPEPIVAGAIVLAWTDVAIAACLVLVAGVISLALRLQMEKRLAWASVRTVAQLFLIGYVLRWAFDLDTLWVVLLVVLVMVTAASRAAVKRPTRSFSGVTWRAFATLVTTGLLTTIFVTAVVISVKPWYSAQYLIPLLGMVFGNGLTGISLCLDHLLELLAERRAEVEMELAHGATKWEAAQRPLAEAVRRGMIPIINSMMVVGLVSLPGMMTGQILAGADPVEAVKYQIVVMFMIAAATSLGCVVIALLTYHRLFDPAHRLRADLITRQKG